MALKERTYESPSNSKIVEAVETLSNIADMELDKHIGITQRHDFIFNDEKISYDTVHWLTHEEADQTVELVKDTFKTILNYLKKFYRTEYSYVADPKAIEGIKTIMVLVGEAAKKLDKCIPLKEKNKSVLNLKEYKQLQEFYLSRIAQKIDEGILSKWILATMSQTTERKKKITKSAKLLTKHIFVDLESVKKDTEYELFFLKKEDGSRFYGPRLIRNIKLLCDFGEYFGEIKLDDPLVDMEVWHDKYFQHAAKNIVDSIRSLANEFYHEHRKFKEKELCDHLHKALIALVLSSNVQNLTRNLSAKSCIDYFHDFQLFLRRALKCSDYHKLLAYPPAKRNKLGKLLCDLTEGLCYSLFSQVKVYPEMISFIHSLIHDANEQSQAIGSNLASKSLERYFRQEYMALNSLLKNHPHGALTKVLHILQQGIYTSYDPIIHKVIPHQLFKLNLEEKISQNLAMPAPLAQEFIHQAHILDEFKGFLHHLHKMNPEQNFLLINLQDRISWKEQARALAVEGLQGQEKNITIVSMAKDTEFYNQQAPYLEITQSESFLKEFNKQIIGESGGFYLPTSLKKNLVPLLEGMLKDTHEIFFASKNVLTREQRLNFIEVFYNIFTLKILEVCQPNFYSFNCKDGIDRGSLQTVSLFTFVKLLNQEILNEKEKEFADWMIYFSAIFNRERLPQAEPFNRMLGALKSLELAIADQGREKLVSLISASKNLSFLLKAKIDLD